MTHVTTGDVRHCIDGNCRCDEVAELRQIIRRATQLLVRADDRAEECNCSRCKKWRKDFYQWIKDTEKE